MRELVQHCSWDGLQGKPCCGAKLIIYLGPAILAVRTHLQTAVDHTVDGIAASTAHTNNFDPGISSCRC